MEVVAAADAGVVLFTVALVAKGTLQPKAEPKGDKRRNAVTMGKKLSLLFYFLLDPWHLCYIKCRIFMYKQKGKSKIVKKFL